ncbi:MAG: hypothetical protein EAZ62_06935, partial [Sphingobacteriia bacterium]
MFFVGVSKTLRGLGSNLVNLGRKWRLWLYFNPLYGVVFVTFAPVQPWLTQLQMKKTLLLLTLLVGMQAIAQNSPEQPKKKIDLTKRTKDHIMLQYGMDAWTNRPDSVRTGNGFSRHFNAYIMMDKPFRLNP